MFGSDWPPCLLAGSYRDMYQALIKNIAYLKEQDKKRVLRLNTIKFYKMEGLDS
jgi:predicted TIM-barrel fold metal-dependent hydrolase